MRDYGAAFAAANERLAKAPQFVVAFLYDVDSIYVTSASVPNVPGTVIDGALAEPSIQSQRLNPDDAAAEIGSASFDLVDHGSAFTQQLKQRQDDGDGIRGRRVQMFLGYAGQDFSEFQLIGTQTVSGVTYQDGRYSISCNDIQRALRSNIFEPVTTTLAASAAAADTTLTLTSTSRLLLVRHGASFTDAPGATVGYVKIKSEVIRYTGIVGNQLTGCTRGVFNTTPEAYSVDPSVPAERREKVTEYIYLELPAIKLAWAVLTGRIWGTIGQLPPHWCLGIAPELVVESDFTGIGVDLWNTADDAAGLVLRFDGLGKEDGKRFLETQVFRLCGVFSPVYSDGRIGLRRMVKLTDDAATAATLDETNSVQVGALEHDMASLRNAFVVNWSWNGNEYRRANAFIDTQSVQIHGRAPTLTLNFKGLHGGRHTDSTVFQLLDIARERFAGPPQRLTVDLLHGMNRLEVGDVVRVRYRHVRDFAGKTATFDRACEVQSVSTNHRQGRVSVELFASTASPSVQSPTKPATALPAAFYTSQGTALASVPGVTIVNNVMTAAPAAPIGGHAVLTNPAAIFYHNADLTIANGVVLHIADNVQLRVAGFLQLNGRIDGRGRGLPGVADDGRALAFPQITSEGPFTAETIPGNAGYVGNSRGYDGVRTDLFLLIAWFFATWPVSATQSRYAAAPRLLLTINGSVLGGLPPDLRGTGGGPGGRVGNTNAVPYPAGARGGPGAAGGAGLLIVCRGMARGGSGSIDLSGADSAPTAIQTANNVDRYPGAGGAGGPGTLYVLLDGADFSVPDLSGGGFRARAGSVPVNGNAMLARRRNILLIGNATTNDPIPHAIEPIAGFNDPEFVTANGRDYSGSALVVQHIPAQEVPVVDTEDAPPPAPTALTATSAPHAIELALALPSFDLFDLVEIYASTTGQRADAARVFQGRASAFRHVLPPGEARSYWTRTRRKPLVSAWFPADPAVGISAAALEYDPAQTIEAQYSPDGSTWHAAPFANGDVFMRQRVGSSGAWSPAIRIVGERGEPGVAGSTGNYVDFVFRRSATTPAAPVGAAPVGWFDAPPPSDGTPLWISTGEKSATGALVGNWSAPALFVRDGELWNATANMVAGLSAFRKVGNTVAWNEAVSSIAKYATCHVVFKAAQTDAYLMVGLNSDPQTDASYLSLDTAFYLQPSAYWMIYENGAPVAGVDGSYSLNTTFAMRYTGSVVEYIVDGVVVRSVAGSGAKYLDSSFYNLAGINSVRFGPGDLLPLTSTGELAPNAATDTYEALSDSYVVLSTNQSRTVSLTFTALANGVLSMTGVLSKGANSGSFVASAEITLSTSDMVYVIEDLNMEPAAGRYTLRGTRNVSKGTPYSVYMKIDGPWTSAPGSLPTFAVRLLCEVIKR